MKSLIPQSFLVSKSVNGGPRLCLGSFPTREIADEQALILFAFHKERCPQDKVEMFIVGS